MLLCFGVHAANQTFTTSTRGGGQDFAYTYKTPAGQPQSLSFRLNLDDIQRGSAEFRDYSNTESAAYQFAAMQAVARTLETPSLQIRLTSQGDNIGIALRGVGVSEDKLSRVKQQLQQSREAAEQEFLKRSMYRSVRGNLIQPDYPTIAKRYTAAMQPVAHAILQQVPGASQNPRAFINAALAWLQTIPYDTLDNRTTSNGAGFQTPYGLILGNLGDCDTKATALAALIRVAYPSIPLSIVIVPDHAFLAIGLPQTADDYALSTTTGVFILADATGPDLSPLGYIDEETRGKLRRQATKTELLPIR